MSRVAQADKVGRMSPSARCLSGPAEVPVNTISIGEILWDVVGETEHLGGAPFNFSAHLAKLGHTVSFISAVGADQRGQRILDSMARMGLSTRYMRQVQDQATGAVTVTLSPEGQPQFVIHRPAAYDFPQLTDAELSYLVSRPVDWIYFGTLLQMSPSAKAVTLRLLESSGTAARRFYDVNLRRGCWDPALVRELMARATMVKLNEEEAVEVSRIFSQPLASLEDFCRRYAGRFGWEGVCITRGEGGCALFLGGEYVEAGGYRVEVADTVGAGDAFAAAFVHGFSSGWVPTRIADFANRVGAVVASRRGAIPSWSLAEAESLQPQRQC
jgi:fructokinase